MKSGTLQEEGIIIEPSGRQSQALRPFMPEKEVECEIVEGQTPEEAGANLALKLR